MGPRCTPEIPGRIDRRAPFDPALPGHQSSDSSQTFLPDHNLHHGMVPPAGTVDQVGYECTTKLDLVERLLKGPADQAQACLGFYPSL